MREIQKTAVLVGLIGCLLAAGSDSATASDLEYDVLGGELEFNLDRPGRSMRWVSEDGNVDLRPGVRLHTDWMVADADRRQIGDDIDIRRLRLHLRGRLWRDWRFKIDGEFSPDRSVEWRNLWLAYRGFEQIEIKVGNQVVPMGLEENISSDNLTFMERSLMGALTPVYSTGGMVRKWTPWTSFQAGAFYAPMTKEKDRHRSHGASVASRFTYAPWSAEGRVLHLGVSGEYRAVDRNSTYRVATRPESSMVPSFISTGSVPNVDDAFTYGFEAAGVYDSFSIQGEYMRTHLVRDSGFNNLEWHGAYVLGSWFLTGESRRYNVKRGNFRWIEPIHKYGAVELAARWSFLDLNDDGMVGGEEHNVTIGANWYVTRNLRLMFNTIFVDAEVRTTRNHDRPTLFMGRVQVVF